MALRSTANTVRKYYKQPLGIIGLAALKLLKPPQTIQTTKLIKPSSNPMLVARNYLAVGLPRELSTWEGRRK